MNPTEATSNIIVAMINNHFICSPEDVNAAYKTIYDTVTHPNKN